jgi:HSP20 family protein
MDVLRWSPFDDLRSIQDEVNRLFEQRSSASPAGAQRRENVSARVWSPPADVYEDENVILLRVDLPGVRQNDIKIDLAGDSLTLSGARPAPEVSEGENYVRLERRYGPFRRSFSIGVPLQQDKVTASYENGVLEVRLPKAEEVKPKRVEVKIGG